MPRELLATAPRTPELREYDEPALGPRQLRIRTEFASPKHGTELVGYRAEPSADRPYDRALGATTPRTEGQRGMHFPMRLGNMAVGTVTEAGPEVSRFRVGDRVFGHFPIRETHTVEEAHADPLPPGLTPAAAVCLDPAVMMMAMRDAGIKLGDRVAMFGLGALGLFGVQMARIAGADRVIALDPIAARRDLALSFGADAALDPLSDGGDAGLSVRELTPSPSPPRAERERVLGGYWERPSDEGGAGVDVAVESSGNVGALHQAIRATRFGGTVCVISFYGGDSAALRLGEEFHINRLRLVSARAESLPMRDYPAWTLARVAEVALRWLVSGRLRTEGIVAPVVPFEDAAEAYREIDEHPERSIKLGIRFG